MNCILRVKSTQEGKERRASKDKQEQDIVKALNAYDKEINLVGETLPTEQRVFWVKAMSTFLKAGVPLNIFFETSWKNMATD